MQSRREKDAGENRMSYCDGMNEKRAVEMKLRDGICRAGFRPRFFLFLRNCMFTKVSK